MVMFFKSPLQPPLQSVPPTLQQATTDLHLCWTLMDTHRQVCVSLLKGHCSFLLSPGVYKVLFVPSESLFLQSCVSSGGSILELMVTFSKRAQAIPKSAVPRAPWQATADHTSTGDTQTLKGMSGSVSVGSPHADKVFFEPSEHLWWIWDQILNRISPLLPSCWGFSFALGCGVSFFWWDQIFSC